MKQGAAEGLRVSFIYERMESELKGFYFHSWSGGLMVPLTLFMVDKGQGV